MRPTSVPRTRTPVRCIIQITTIPKETVRRYTESHSKSSDDSMKVVGSHKIVQAVVVRTMRRWTGHRQARRYVEQKLDNLSDFLPGNRRENHTRSPPPERPQYIPPPASFSGGGNIINTDSYNVNNTHVDDAFNDNSRTYQCKYLCNRSNLFLISVKMVLVDLPPTNGVVISLKIRQGAKKIQFLTTKIFNPTVDRTDR